VLVDQRVRQLPLGARDLQPVALDRRKRSLGHAEPLALGDELSDSHRESVHRVAVSAAPETRSTQGLKGRAAGHVSSIGARSTEVKPHFSEQGTQGVG
jgi:hypothetical protein